MKGKLRLPTTPLFALRRHRLSSQLSLDLTYIEFLRMMLERRTTYESRHQGLLGEMNEMSKDFIAASATPLILSILNQGDSYGYAIIQNVRELTNGELEWADGMLYPILHRLEKQKLIESYWGKAENGRKRKYYRLRKTGSAELVRLRDNWRRINVILDNIRELRPCST
jgi:PadR family transcriptional regulator, regulatory protein PadR